MENEEIKNTPETAAQPAAQPVPSVPSDNRGPRDNRNPSNRGGRDSRFGGRGRFGGRRQVVKEYEERVVHIGRITKVVKGGKRMRFSALVVIGNRKGRFGFGLAKSAEVPDAIKKAIVVANANLKNVPIVKNDTIPHIVEGNFGACKVFLKPAPAGTGIVAGGPVRAVLELAGIKNVYSKVYGSRGSLNVIRATVDGISQLHTESLAKTLLLKEAAAKEAEKKPMEETKDEVK